LSAKIERVCKEIEKTKIKLSEQQARLRELEKQKTELENMEIVDVVRGMDISLADLAALLKTGSTTSGQVGPKSAQAADLKPEIETEDNQDEE